MKARVWAVNPEETVRRLRERLPDYHPYAEQAPYVTVEVDADGPGRFNVVLDLSIAEADELLEQLKSAIVAAKAFPTVGGVK
jgi:hypothetical protein